MLSLRPGTESAQEGEKGFSSSSPSIVRKHVELASEACPTLKGKRVTPHVLRHSAAMQLLQNGMDRTVVALRLGHESVESTQMYVHADIQLKERAMAKTKPIAASPGRYRPSDKLLAFLEGSDYADVMCGSGINRDGPRDQRGIIATDS